MASILLTGGTGRLGRALVKELGGDVWAPSRSELDITNPASCRQAIVNAQPEVVFHAAALADAVLCERYRNLAWRTNVAGTENMLLAARNVRLFVFMSTDYIFDGEKGSYSEDDLPRPLNFYGLTKFAAEMAVRQRERQFLILRAPFRADPPWRYPEAFTDQITSCVYASERAPQIARALRMDLGGIVHIGGPKRSIFTMAKESRPDVGQTLRYLAGVALPRDTSLDDTFWRSQLEARNANGKL